MNTRFSFLVSFSAQSFLYGTQLLPSRRSAARAYHWPHTYMHDGLLLVQSEQEARVHTNIVMKYVVELGDKYGKEPTPAQEISFSDCTCTPCYSLQRVPLNLMQFRPVQTVFGIWVRSHQPSTWSISAAFIFWNLSAGLLKWSCESWCMVDSCYGKLRDGSFSLAHLIFLDSWHCLVQESGYHRLVASAHPVSDWSCMLFYGLFVSWAELQRGQPVTKQHIAHGVVEPVALTYTVWPWVCSNL